MGGGETAAHDGPVQQTLCREHGAHGMGNLGFGGRATPARKTPIPPPCPGGQITAQAHVEHNKRPPLRGGLLLKGQPTPGPSPDRL